jgi:translocation and assembly module TamB
VNAQQAPLARPNGNGGVQPVSVQRLVEEKWDFRQPLLLLGPEVESASGQAVRQAVPNFPYLRLSDLKVEIGPDLQVLVPPVATFRTGGRLTLDGPIGPDLTARGVVRLKGGRLTLFTTTFTLDPDAPNVAVFTPSLGLVPYLDIAMRTRVSNSLDLGKQGGVITPIELRGDFTPLDQLNLVRVVVSVSGPADRLGESLVIRSNPPLSQSRLVALIGGNSLAGLSGGNAGAALATVVGQSLLSPLVSGLTDAFGQRFSFAIYPSYVVPTERQTTARTSRRVPSQLVLGTEAGVDLSDRFNFSVLAAPNRSDIPPQGTLRYQASETFGLQGSVDTEGRWQGQLQLFFRF